jgi:hypothetical protein
MALGDTGSVPTKDGDLNEFTSGEARQTGYFRTDRKALFINGMNNSGEDHRRSATRLSLLQMCPVLGIFNQSDGVLADLGQCIVDKYQFDGPLAQSPEAALRKAMNLESQKPGGQTTPAQVMESVLARNKAALEMFRLARKSEHRQSPIFAHSQGNLILSNVLTAITLVDGAEAIGSREIYTFGSPAKSWPKGTL